MQSVVDQNAALQHNRGSQNWGVSSAGRAADF